MWGDGHEKEKVGMFGRCGWFESIGHSLAVLAIMLLVVLVRP